MGVPSATSEAGRRLSSEQKAEREAVVAAMIAAALLIAQQVAARTTRDALFLSAFRIESLPLVMMASAVLALVGAESMSLALARRSPRRVMPVAIALSSLLLVVEWALVRQLPRAGAVVVYLHVAAFGGALVSGFWSLVNERFDPYTARRVMARIGTGATAGGVAGGGLAWLASRSLAVSTSLLLLGALGALAAAAILRVSGRPAAVPPRQREPSSPALALPLLARTPYLRDLALVVALGAVVDAMLDFLFKAKAVERFGGGAELMSVFAVFHVVLSLVSLLFQALFARTVLQQLGLAGTVALRPLVGTLAAALGAIVPRFATAALARGSHESLTNSLFRSGYELFYTPLPEGDKRRVKAVIDVAVDKAGTVLGSALVAVALVAVPIGSDRLLFAVAALVSLGTIGLSRRLHGGYVGTLEQSLLAGRVRLDSGDALDRTTQLTLAHSGLIERGALLKQIEALRGGSQPSGVASTSSGEGTLTPLAPAPPPEGGLLDDLSGLASGSPTLVRRALRRHPEPSPVVVASLVPLLSRDELYPDIVRTLRRVAARVTGQLVDALLDPSVEPVVRRRIPRILKASPTPRSVSGLTAALDDELFGVRASAAAALASLHERSALVSLSRAAVFDRVRRELRESDGGERPLAHVFSLLSLALEPQPLRIAWAALRGTDGTLRGTALEYLSTVLPDDVFTPLRAQVAPGRPAPTGPRRTAEQVVQELRSSSAGIRLTGVSERKAEEPGG